MSISAEAGSVVATPGQSVALGSMFAVTSDAGDPQYLVVSGLDRDEYTAAAKGSFGTFNGNGASMGYTSLGGDSYGAGIVFTYNATTGRYTNATFGDFANVTLTASTDVTRNESISVFGTNNLSAVASIANDPYSLSDAATYLGSVSVVTAAASQPAAQATPNSIVSSAMSFVGQAWNQDGCWVLASNISAKAGASLPITSTSLGIDGVANGEWIVAYDGPAGDTGDWQSSVKAGEMIVFATSATSGHITTCVAGSGATAELIDNITYVTSSGAIANSAKDGSASDIVVSAPHLASQEFAQAVAGSVVVYELDTPIVTTAAGAPTTVGFGSATALSSLVTATDPGTRAVTEYQVYDVGNLGAAADTFIANGASVSAHSAATAITTSAAGLASTFLQAASSIGVDTLMVRAYNGAYWGDWTSENVAVIGTGSTQTPTPAPTTPAGPPVVANQTANQVYMRHQVVSLTLAANTFASPDGSALTYSATQLTGRPLHLTFDAATSTFSGTLLNRRASARMQVTATDAAGHSTSEYFKVTVASNSQQFSQAVAALHGPSGVSDFVASAAHTQASHALAAVLAMPLLKG